MSEAPTGVLACCDGLQFVVEHEVDSGVRGVTEYGGQQPGHQAPPSLQSEDCLHSADHAGSLVAKLRSPRLPPGLDDGERHQNSPGNHPGKAAHCEGLQGRELRLVSLAQQAGQRMIGGEVKTNARNCPPQGRSHSGPETQEAFRPGYQSGLCPDTALGRLLDPGLDQVKGLQQHCGTGSTEGSGQK